MGVATTNVFDRVLASIGGSNSGVQTRFERCEDVRSGGVLLALPALLCCGLLRHCERFFNLPKGYYSLVNIFLLLGMMSLNRVNSIEQLRLCPPGEWGKLLGLDRSPCVKTLRKKLKGITANEESVKGWSSTLSKDWIETESLKETAGGTLYYVDGHLRVYHGSQTKLPRHYVARQRLCLRATSDYWVSQADGQPVFKVNTVVDPGLLTVLEEQIVPQLLEDVPDQRSEEQLKEDPYLSRFRLVFDREGYSPGFFTRMWEKRIACQTYRKGSYEPWAEEEFVGTEVKLKTGQLVQWKLAERGVRIGSKKTEMIWVREVRKLTEKGHQTAILSTQYYADIESVAQEQFGRWSLENFFRYARKSMNIDALVDYQLESIPETVKVVNPAWRELDGQVRKRAAKLATIKGEFANHTLQGTIEKDKVEAFLERKEQLIHQISEQTTQLESLKTQRREQKRKIPVSELPQEDSFQGLCHRSKHFIDIIKLIAFRGETMLSEILREKINLHHQDEVRALARQIFQTEANLIPDPGAKTLTVEVHAMSTPKEDTALEHLCAELTETQTKYPGTEMTLVYKKVSLSVP